MPRKLLTAADRRLRFHYGITLEEYNQILAHQHGCCAICQRPARLFKTRLAVDHCHITGQLRGLLCSWCNRALGKFARMVWGDRTEISKLQSAVAYLMCPPVTKVLGPRVSAPGRVGSKKRLKLLKSLTRSE